MKLIKNAIVYRLQLPEAERLAEHLAGITFQELRPEDYATQGFYPLRDTQELVSTFEGGLAFSIRYDEKIVPARAVNVEANRRIKEIETREDQAMSRVERQAIRELVFSDLCRTALHNTAIIQAYYHPESQTLMVSTGSKKQAGILVNLLISAVGSVKSTTIHVNAMKGSLTERMRNHLNNGSEGFGPFEVEGECKLQGEKRSMSVKVDSLLNQARASLMEMIDSGASVISLRLKHIAVSFRLTQDFHFKTIGFEYTVEADKAADFDAKQAWQHEASIQTLAMVAAINDMCDLLGYKEPTEETASEAAAA